MNSRRRIRDLSRCAPGHSNRKELEGLYIRSAVIKKLTGKETPVYAATFNDRCEIYTVRDTVGRRQTKRLSRRVSDRRFAYLPNF